MVDTRERMVDVSHYTFRVTWSAEDDEFVANGLEFPSLSWPASSRTQAIEGLEQLVADVVDDMRANDEKVPEPIAERRFSGTFNVRIGEHLHRDLAMNAAEQHMSLNQFVVKELGCRLSRENRHGIVPPRRADYFGVGATRPTMPLSGPVLAISGESVFLCRPTRWMSCQRLLRCAMVPCSRQNIEGGSGVPSAAASR